MQTNKNIIELKISDFEVEHEEITYLLDLNPTHIWIKGEEYLFGNKNQVKKTMEKNYWKYNSTALSNAWIGEQLERFIEDIIVPRKDALKMIAARFHVELSIVQYLYDSCNPGLYFDKKVLKILSDCGLELNIDLYVLTQDENKGD
ncbi:MAG: DUF4279 domain-containing protein [Daejeonella sp.]